MGRARAPDLACVVWSSRNAGPNHEVFLAVHASGAVAISKTKRATVMNVGNCGVTH